MSKKFCYLSVLFLFVNILFFAIYRFIFLHIFATDQSLSVLLSGMRLDIALLFVELFLFGFYCILHRYCLLNQLLFFTNICTLTHVICCTINILFFKERGQQLGEGLMAYIATPKELWIAIFPFCKKNILLILLGALALIGWIILSYMWSKKVKNIALDLWKSKKNCIISILIILSFLLPSLEIITVKKSKSALGFQLKITHSKYYTTLSNFTFNQAIPNPLYELFRVYIPLSLRPTLSYHLDQEKALHIVQDSLHIENNNKNYPLMRTISSPLNLGFENVVIVQVEGLSQSVLEYKSQNQQVMPFCKKLSEDGIYFPNILQSYNATSGGFYSVATSVHKDCFQQKQKIFTTPELNCNLGTLSKLLPKNEYDFYVATPFRQNIDDFRALTNNQEFKSYMYSEFHERLKAKGLSEQAEDDQGILDDYFLQECCDIIESSPKKFVFHLLTVTSHSPWTTPKSFKTKFDRQSLNAYAYTDQCIQHFMERMQKNQKLFNKTLFVFIADHTSLYFTDDFLERNRIPLIFYHPALKQLVHENDFTNIYGSQVDVLPSILYLLGGNHFYSGFGKNLFAKEAKSIGSVGGNREYGTYYKDSWLLQYSPASKIAQLFKVEHDRVIYQNVANEYKEIFERMYNEYMAHYETACHLIQNKRIFPLNFQE